MQNRVSVLASAIGIASLGDVVDPASAIYIDRDLARSNATRSQAYFDSERRPIKIVYYFDDEDFIIDLFVYLANGSIAFYGERFTRKGIRASKHLQAVRVRDMDNEELRKNCESLAISNDAQGRPIAATYYFPGRMVVIDTFTYANNTDTEPISATYGEIALATNFLEVALSAASGTLNSPIVVTYSYPSGFPAGTTIIPICLGLAGTFDSNALNPATGATQISTTFTPAENGYGQFSATNNMALGSPAPKSLVISTGGNFTYATAYSAVANPATGWQIGSPVTISINANGSIFPPNTIITPSVSGATGTFSPSTLNATGTTGSLTFTQTGAGTPSISFTNNKSLLDPALGQVYATAYTVQASPVAFEVGQPITLTFTATGGVFPVGTTIVPTASGVAGSLSAASVAASGSTASLTFTPSATGNLSISFADNQNLGDPSPIVGTVVRQRISWNLYNGATASNDILTIPVIQYATGQSQSLVSSLEDIQFLFDSDFADSSCSVELTTGVPIASDDAVATFPFLRVYRLRLQYGGFGTFAVYGSDYDGGGQRLSSQVPVAVNSIVSFKKSGTSCIVRADGGSGFSDLITVPNVFLSNETLTLACVRRNVLNKHGGTASGPDSPQASTAPITIATFTPVIY